MKNAKAIIDLHLKLIINLLDFFKQQGIQTYDDVVAYKMKGVIDEPLWKIVEAYGKYNVDYISDGIKHVADTLDMPYNNLKVSNIKGFLKSNLPYTLPSGQIITDIKDCTVQLEHVTPRKAIIEHLLKLKNEKEIKNFINEFCLGCVVIKAEHNLLQNNFNVNKRTWQRYQKAGLKVWDKTNLNYIK